MIQNAKARARNNLTHYLPVSGPNLAPPNQRRKLDQQAVNQISGQASKRAVGRIGAAWQMAGTGPGRGMVTRRSRRTRDRRSRIAVAGYCNHRSCTRYARGLIIRCRCTLDRLELGIECASLGDGQEYFYSYCHFSTRSPLIRDHGIGGSGQIARSGRCGRSPRCFYFHGRCLHARDNPICTSANSYPPSFLATVCFRLSWGVRLFLAAWRSCEMQSSLPLRLRATLPTHGCRSFWSIILRVSIFVGNPFHPDTRIIAPHIWVDCGPGSRLFANTNFKHSLVNRRSASIPCYFTGLVPWNRYYRDRTQKMENCRT